MKVTVEKKEGNQLHVAVEIEGQGLAERYQQALGRHSKNINVKGFRKGKVPRSVAEKHLNLDAIKRDIFEQAISDSYQQALQQHQIEPIAEPNIEAVQAEIGKDLIYKAVIEIRPEVVLGEYKSLTVTVPAPTEATEEAIQDQLQHLQRQHATLIPVEDRGAQLGDLATLHLQGFMEGEPIDLGESHEMTIELKEHSFVTGFAQEIEGMKEGEEKEFTIQFPSDYYLKDLQDKPIQFKVKMLELKQVELAELDDEFAKSLGDFESLDTLKERIKSDLSEALEEQNELKKQQRVLEEIANKATVELPETMVNREMFAMWQMSEGQQLQNAKVSEQTMRLSLANWMQRPDIKETAQQRIKTTLVLGAVARQEQIMVTHEELHQEIHELAEQYGADAHQLEQQLHQEGRIMALMDEVLSFKIISWLMENNTTVVGDVSDAAPAAEAATDTSAPEVLAESQSEPAEVPSDVSNEESEKTEQPV